MAIPKLARTSISLRPYRSANLPQNGEAIPAAKKWPKSDAGPLYDGLLRMNAEFRDVKR